MNRKDIKSGKGFGGLDKQRSDTLAWGDDDDGAGGCGGQSVETPISVVLRPTDL